MKKKIVMLVVSLALITVGLLAASFSIVPHSVRLYMASVATCENLEEALLSSGDPQFEGIKSWETPLALIYRLKYWHLGGPTRVSDGSIGESSVYTVFVTTANATGGECDAEILQLFERYIDGSRSLDDYDVTGYTALHQAIVFQKIEFVRVLLSGGANTSLAVRGDNKFTNGKSAVELAVWFSEQEYSPPNSAEIATMLVSAD